MTNYNLYYPIRYRNKTKNFVNIYNKWKAVENQFGSLKKQDVIIDRYFGSNLPNSIKISKSIGLILYRKFEQNGSNIFHFTKELLELFKQTDVSDIQIKNIKFPYNNFYISLRELDIPVKNDKDRIIDGVYVNFTDDEKEDLIYSHHINFDVCCYSKQAGENEFDYKVKDDIVEMSDLSFENRNSTISDAINGVFEIMKNTMEETDRTKEQIQTEIDYQLDAFNVFKNNINLIINCILYISSEKPDIEKDYATDLPTHLKNNYQKAKTKHQKEIEENKIQQFGYSKINLVGKTFKKNTTNQDLSSVAPHWRRGHWRNQKYGHNLSQSKLIWIMPTVVNKEKGDPEKGHIYSIEK